MKTRLFQVAVLATALALVFPGFLFGQQTTGGIQGVVKDSTGAVLPGVALTVSDPKAGLVVDAVSNDSGLYVVRSLQAGVYEVKASLEGFKTQVTAVTVEVGRLTNGNITLEVGDVNEIVTVQGQAIKVDTSAHTVTGVITSNEVTAIPLNGRNFLDLAQLEPGVQLVDGGSFDPTKNQFTGISVGGRSGRVTRISIDGIDISDETVGTTVQNISVDAVQEFQVSQSSLDPSTSLTSSGSVNVISKSGSNAFHGSGFFFYRDEEVAALPVSRTGSAATIANLESAEFDREQGGFEFGGPFIKDKLFFFLNYEKLNQDGTTFTSVPNFPQFNGGVITPFNDNLGLGRLDWNVSNEMRVFFRFSTETNDAATGFGGVGVAPFVNQNVTNVLATGLDVATSKLTHSVRYGHTSFDNEISTNSLGLPQFMGSNGLAVAVNINNRSILSSGPNRLAPQATYQTDQQYKYDGGWVTGNHTVRYGAEVKWIKDNLFASFYGVGPEARLSFSAAIRQAIINRGGNPEDPLEYPVSNVVLGNGQGSFSEIPNNGRPLGGVNNTRIGWYVADSWRIHPSFNLNLGVRWGVDTGQVNDDLPLPQELAGLLGADGVRPTRLDKNNFGPQIGFAWEPFGDNKTVIRGGGGIFYETQIVNNTLFDRTDRLPAGLGFSVVQPPFSGIDGAGRIVVGGVPVNDINAAAWAGQPLGSVINQIAQSEIDYQVASAAVGFDPNNPPLILADATTSAGPAFIQDYSTPYGLQANIGVQRQLTDNLVLSVDFVRNRNLHHNIVRDFNTRRSVANFDAVGAAAHLADVLAARGVSSVDQAIAAGVPFSAFGMENYFGTADPDFSTIQMIMSSGISTYKALQFRLTGRSEKPIPGIHSLFMDVSYALGKFEGMSADQDFLPVLSFNDGYLQERNFGPAGLDRTHQVTAAFFMDIPWGFHLNWNHRWGTALPATLVVPQQVGGNREIFYTDFDGDGTVGDFLPGTSRGAFSRGIGSVSDLNQVINAYNASGAGQLTAAGQTLVAAGLFTQAQLTALGAVTPTIPTAPSGQVLNDSFLNTDVRVSKDFNIGGERVKITPAVEIFNLFNVANYGILSGTLTGTAGSVNGTVAGNRTNRLGLGSGSFSQGIPRSVQFAIRVSF